MTPQVAKDIVAYCTSCRMDLTHTIVAVEEDKVVRVLCQTCKKEHAFRSPADTRVARKKRQPAKNALPVKTKVTADEWEKEMDLAKDLPPKPYALNGFYKAGEKVDHHTFGMGLVKNLISPDKMEILFQEGIKLLIRGNSRINPQS